MIIERLKELLANGTSLADKISVQSDAGKFRVCELDWDGKTSSLSPEAKARFGALPVAWGGGERAKSIGRPIYLRRGAYFDAISRVFGGDFTLLPNTVFCGDIWEMDLALPHAALGAHVHLVDRTAPFNTYEHEKRAIETYGQRAKASDDLSGLLAWLQRPPQFVAGMLHMRFRSQSVREFAVLGAPFVARSSAVMPQKNWNATCKSPARWSKKSVSMTFWS